MSAITNLFNRNKAANPALYNTSSSNTAILGNAENMNNSFLHRGLSSGYSTLPLNSGLSNSAICTEHAGHPTIVKEPIIDQTFTTQTITEVQPVIHRQIEQPQVHHIEEHIWEKQGPVLNAQGVQTFSTLPQQETLVRTAPLNTNYTLSSRSAAPPLAGKRGFNLKNLFNKRSQPHQRQYVGATGYSTLTPSLPLAQQQWSQQQWTQQQWSEQQWSQQQLPIQQEREIIQTETIQQPVINTTQKETRWRPAVYEQTFRTDKVVQVQPILHREVEQPIINHIEKHITEAPAASRGGVVRLQPVVQENVRTRVINEVQPIVHREIAQRSVERVEEHFNEHVVADARHTRAVQFEQTPAAPIIERALPIAPVAQAPTILETISAPAVHQTVTKTAIVDEKIRTDRVVEVQPVVHREVEQPIVNHIEKHITEAPAPQMGGTVRMLPIVQETVNTRIVEEIQPVIHRELAVAQVERVEEHLSEHIVAPARHTREVITERPTVINEIQPIIHRETVIPQVERQEMHFTERIVEPAIINNTIVNETISPVSTYSLNQSAGFANTQTITNVLPSGGLLNQSAGLTRSSSFTTLNQPAALNSSLPLNQSAGLVNTQSITKVVPDNLSLLEKQQQEALLTQRTTPTYGSAMM